MLAAMLTAPLLLQGSTNRAAPEMLRLRSRKATAPRETAVARPAERQPGRGTRNMKHKTPRDKDCSDAGLFLQMQMMNLLSSSNRGVSTASVSRNSMALVEYACRGRRGSWILLSGSPDGIQPTHLRCCVTMESKQNLQARTCLLSCLLNDRSRLAPGPGGEDVPTRNSVADRDGRLCRQSVTACLSSRIGSRENRPSETKGQATRGALMQSMILRAEIIGRFFQHGNAFASLLVLQTDEPN